MYAELARAVGADLDGQLIGKICEKKGSDIKLWDSATRAAKSSLGPADGSRAMIDAIHHAAHLARTEPSRQLSIFSRMRGSMAIRDFWPRSKPC